MTTELSSYYILHIKSWQELGIWSAGCRTKTRKQKQKKTNYHSGVWMFTTRCPSCFSLETAPSAAVPVVVGSEYLSHLSMTCLCRPRVHPSCPEVRVTLKPNKKTFLYSSASSLAFPAFPPPFAPLLPQVPFIPSYPLLPDKRITLLFIQGDWCC